MREGVHEVRQGEEGWTLSRWLRERFILGPRTALDLITSGRLSVAGHPVTDPSRRLTPGERFTLAPAGKPRARVADFTPNRGPKDRSSTPAKEDGRRKETVRRERDIVIEYMDDQIIVVRKPAGVTTQRSAREAAEFGERARSFLPPTLLDQLRRQLSGGPQAPLPKLWAVHRIDQDTSGLVVFARTQEAATDLSNQFREHGIVRKYWAVTRGEAAEQTIQSHLMLDRGDGRRGSGPEGPDTRHAVTHVRVVQRFTGFTWVECELETGRTHQIRIHLGEAGTPLCGERIYDRPLHGGPRPEGGNFPRIALHAHTLGIKHPSTGKQMVWHAPWPPDLLIPLQVLAQQSNVKLANPMGD
jgi:23S rRNA pseudouridine1911/1915/1917 synthase